MELREYMSIRRAYNLVRQTVPTSERLTFEEYAILAHLFCSGEPQKTSVIADYQQVLRPTMTHRTNHLARLGLIERQEGDADRRNVCCKISEEGINVLVDLSEKVCNTIPKGYPLHRINAQRTVSYADAMGSFFCTARDLSLLGLFLLGGETTTVTALVDVLGLLQPTVSMSVSMLAEAGLCARSRNVETTARTVSISLTEAGESRCHDIAHQIEDIVVHRHRQLKF